MKRPTLKRTVIGIFQHIAAALICTTLAAVMFNSYISTDSMEGRQTYYLAPLSAEDSFEDSDLFREIFQTAVSDVTKLVVIKGQMETNGVFDPHKKVDVTKFANRKGNGNNCPITAVYELEDLINWGKSGVQFKTRPFDMSLFVNYFGPATAPENFALDENGQLYFNGFYGNVSVYDYVSESGKENLPPVMEAMLSYSTKELEDMALSYIMARNYDEISMAREDDGSYTVYVNLLISRKSTITGEKELFNCAENWPDYIRLQQNVAESATHLAENYANYVNGNNMYKEESSNLKYVVRMRTEEGLSTYTNVATLKDIDESDITEYFSEYRRYLIYYPDNLVFMGNSSMSEEDIYAYLSAYDYAYPETSHIWLGVDTNHLIEGDGIYKANYIYQKIVPNMGLIVFLIVLFVIIWLILGIYLTVEAGIATTATGDKVAYLNGFDHIWTELLVVFIGFHLYGVYWGAQRLREIAEAVYQQSTFYPDEVLNLIYEYGMFACFGFLASMFMSMLWFSIVRRVRSNNLWKTSFLNWLRTAFSKLLDMMFRHRNMAISTLIPYNIFILINLSAIFFASNYLENAFLIILVLLCLIAMDGAIGVVLFKKNAEQIDIVEGIQKIRDGEVDFKLETQNLHGTNKEVADAVNNIGEGIRNAVKTSMKDEQMKTDLITNVSHDIKTPLTSIINYVDLLKRLKLEEEPAKTYIEVLDSKAKRLKQLTDDLVEASKISSGNIELKKEKINLTELMNQAIGEFSEKLEEQKLQIVMETENNDAFIFADSRRMWRVFENLFNNICKYALESTRVYVNVRKQDGMVEFVVKNISRRQMNIQPDELTERFIRGDSARSTEGSGLGLSIAKSLVQVQGGTFEIDLDGDLFKVVIRFKEYLEEAIIKPE